MEDIFQYIFALLFVVISVIGKLSGDKKRKEKTTAGAPRPSAVEVDEEEEEFPSRTKPQEAKDEDAWRRVLEQMLGGEMDEGDEAEQVFETPAETVQVEKSTVQVEKPTVQVEKCTKKVFEEESAESLDEEEFSLEKAIVYQAILERPKW